MTEPTKSAEEVVEGLRRIVESPKCNRLMFFDNAAEGHTETGRASEHAENAIALIATLQARIADLESELVDTRKGLHQMVETCVSHSQEIAQLQHRVAELEKDAWQVQESDRSMLFQCAMFVASFTRDPRDSRPVDSLVTHARAFVDAAFAFAAAKAAPQESP